MSVCDTVSTIIPNLVNLETPLSVSAIKEYLHNSIDFKKYHEQIYTQQQQTFLYSYLY